MPYYPPRPDQQPGDRSQPESPPHGKRFLRRAVVCVSVLMILYGAVRLIGYGADWFSSRQTTQELREIAAETDNPEQSVLPDVSETPEPAQETAPVYAGTTDEPKEENAQSDMLPVVEYPNGYELVSRIQKLRKKGEYIIGWITMDEIDEPVAQKDNTFFLDHDATGKKNWNGCIFMDQDISLLTRPYTILLYGHNMKTGAMFGNLRKYEDFSWYSQHREFTFDTLYEEGRYAIFATETISLTPGTARYVNLTGLMSRDRKTRKEAIRGIQSRSLYDTMLDVNEEDQILLLITCTGDDDERLIVAARRLTERE